MDIRDAQPAGSALDFESIVPKPEITLPLTVGQSVIQVVIFG